MPVLNQNPKEDAEDFNQWITAMKMVVQLPGGIPGDFRSRLWLALADRYLTQREVCWEKVEKVCFHENFLDDETNLKNQIEKDLHRTGCTLFCGEAGKENQILLKTVLLAYARWNKDVGYCQGFNMLAALILQVTNRQGQDALKVMIYLVEGVLPDSYFANNLQGLSVDMAVFRDLMHLKLPKLSQHLERLQNSKKSGDKSYEPPLTNMFTIQWFLTLFCNCLPQSTVLRIWDLIFLDGNEVVLKTALCIWKIVSDKIIEVKSADEFYGTMADLTKRLLTLNYINANALVRAIVTIGPLNGLNNLRKQYLNAISQKRTPMPHNVSYKQTMPLDISALKKQYSKIKQRQKQAHVIFFSALSRQQNQTQPGAINHLLVKKSETPKSGKSKSAKENNVSLIKPPPIVNMPRNYKTETLHWKDKTSKINDSSSSSSTDTELCDDERDELSDNEEDICDLVNNSSNINSDNNSASEIVQTLKFNPVNTNLEKKTINIKKVLPLEKVFIETKSESNEIPFLFDSASSKEENFIDLESISEMSSNDNQIPVLLDSKCNSLNALKIMQENSMILHRIMNCQNRTPSPPSISETVDMSNCNTYTSNFSLLKNKTSVPNVCENIQLLNCDNESVLNVVLPLSSSSSFIDENIDFSIDSIESIHPTHSYRNQLFEKSISLDEKYNDLILNKTICPLSTMHESKSESFIPDQLFENKNQTVLMEDHFVTSSQVSYDLESDRVLCNTESENNRKKKCLDFINATDFFTIDNGCDHIETLSSPSVTNVEVNNVLASTESTNMTYKSDKGIFINDKFYHEKESIFGSLSTYTESSKLLGSTKSIYIDEPESSNSYNLTRPATVPNCWDQANSICGPLPVNEEPNIICYSAEFKDLEKPQGLPFDNVSFSTVNKYFDQTGPVTSTVSVIEESDKLKLCEEPLDIVEPKGLNSKGVTSFSSAEKYWETKSNTTNQVIVSPIKMEDFKDNFKPKELNSDNHIGEYCDFAEKELCSNETVELSTTQYTSDTSQNTKSSEIYDVSSKENNDSINVNLTNKDQLFPVNNAQEEKIIDKSSRQLIEENVKVLDFVLNRKKQQNLVED